MRTLTAALSAALGAAVQRPALLVEIAFSVTRRWSSHADLTWNGQSWLREVVAVDGLQVDALSVRGTLSIQNRDDVIGALVFNEGVTDRSIRLWGYDAGATAAADVVWLADAVGGDVEIDVNQVRIGLRHPAEHLVAPRTFVAPAAGFNTLLAAGTVLRINGRDLRLDRR